MLSVTLILEIIYKSSFQINKNCVKKSYKSTFLIYWENYVNKIQKENKIAFTHFVVNFINYNNNICNKFTAKK